MNGIKILIVDDEKRLLRLLKRGLESICDQYHIQTADSGMQALELVKNEVFDVIITDIRMPVIDGLELLNRMDAIQGSVKKIVMTGHANREDVMSEQPRHFESIDFFRKPVSFGELYQSIEAGKQSNFGPVPIPGV